MEHSARRTFTPVTFTLTCVFQTPPPQLARTSALLPRHSLQPELLLPPEVFPGGLRTHSTVNHKPEEAADAVVMTTRSKKKKNKKKIGKTLAAASRRSCFPLGSWMLPHSRSSALLSQALVGADVKSAARGQPKDLGREGMRSLESSPKVVLGGKLAGWSNPCFSHRNPNLCRSGEG